ncbi:Bud site selection protein 6 [Microbotryomycetes sp. JL221]|nr:Bud site selection protein 6 [Microbotryomycetes sp. JL221]
MSRQPSAAVAPKSTTTMTTMVPTSSSSSSTTISSMSKPSSTRPATSSRGSVTTHSSSAPTSHMESTITRLLVATKQLLEGLAKWSRGEVSEEHISDIYVKLGNDFNVACAAFQRENIAMNELLSVPTDLRECLETCLSEQPSQSTLEKHLPQVRQIIIGLLHGLREKQRLYRDGAAQRRLKERERDNSKSTAVAASRATNVGGDPMTRTGSGSSLNRERQGSTTTMRSIASDQVPMTPNSADKSKEELRQFVSQATTTSNAVGPTHSTSTSSAGSSSRNSLTSAALTSSGMQTSIPTSVPVAVAPSEVSSSNSSFVSVQSRQDNDQQPQTATSPVTTQTTTRSTKSTSDVGAQRQEMRRSASEETTSSLSGFGITGHTGGVGPSYGPSTQSTRAGRPIGGSLRESTRSRKTLSNSQAGNNPTITDSSRASGSFSNSNQRWSTSSSHAGSPPPPPREPDKWGPMPYNDIATSPQTNFDESTAPSRRPSNLTTRRISSSFVQQSNDDPPIQQSAAQLESLEALKHSEHLSRRASKRYSAYTIQKMTSPMREGGKNSTGTGVKSVDLGLGSSSSSSLNAARELASDSSINNISGGMRRARTEIKSSRPGFGRDDNHLTTIATTGNNGTNYRNLPPLPPIPTAFSNMDLKSSGVVQPIVEEPLSSNSNLGGDGESEQDGRDVDSSVRTRPMSIVSSVPSSFVSSPALHDNLPEPPLPTTPTSEGANTTLLNAGDKTPNAQIVNSTSSTKTNNDSSTTMTSTFSTFTTVPNENIKYPIHIFLQIGRDVKKVELICQPTLSSLKQLFIEKFQFNPGPRQDFPNVYVRDREVGVHYELEDLNDVKNGSVLSLNIDAIEQVKTYIDNGLASLAQEMKELRSTVTAMRRVSMSAAAVAAVNSTLLSPDLNNNTSTTIASPFANVSGLVTHSPVVRASPSEQQFQDAASKVVRMKRLGSIANIDQVTEEQQERSATEVKEEINPIKEIANKEDDSNVKVAASSPTQSVSSDAYTSQVIGTLKLQHEQVSNLRQDIAILRQVYIDFVSQTRQMINQVRIQSSHVNKIASTKLSHDRTFVEQGTNKLDNDSTELVVKVDELSDTIEAIRSDTVRGIRSKPSQLSELRNQLNKLDKTRNELTDWLKLVKPKWQELWSNELAKVLGEQEKVSTQETLLNDLAVDLDDVRDVLNKVEIVSKQSKGTFSSTTSRAGGAGFSTSGVGPGTSPTLLEDDQEQQQLGREGVLLQVQALKPDPTRRLEAIERAERQRQVELASRTDEFEQELSGFVSQNKLRKSGGIQETERRRQVQNEQTLKAMFSS